MKLPTLSMSASYSQGFPLDSLRPTRGLRLSGGGGIPAPKPGCWFVGTQCRIGYQTCKYCCGDGQSYTQQCGWCIGWYDAPPCVGHQF